MTELRSFAFLGLVATATIACSGTDDPAAPVISVTIVRPHEGESFAISADNQDIDFELAFQNFAPVLAGQEGPSLRKGQVRLYVDDDLCNDPGKAPDEPAVPYNAIYPNEANEHHLGMDYCFGGAAALDNATHTLEAQIWNGATRLMQPAASQRITFKTTYSAAAEAGTSEPTDGATE